MRNWIKTVNIKKHLTGDDSDESAVKVGKAIADELERGLRQPRHRWREDFDLEEMIEELREVENCADLNDVLAGVYDWADANSIWMGP